MLLQSVDAQQVEESVIEWHKRMQRLSKSMPLAEQRQLADKLRGELEQWREYVPVVVAVCNPGMRGRHWDALSQAMGTKVRLVCACRG